MYCIKLFHEPLENIVGQSTVAVSSSLATAAALIGQHPTCIGWLEERSGAFQLHSIEGHIQFQHPIQTSFRQHPLDLLNVLHQALPRAS